MHYPKQARKDEKKCRHFGKYLLTCTDWTLGPGRHSSGPGAWRRRHCCSSASKGPLDWYGVLMSGGSRPNNTGRTSIFTREMFVTILSIFWLLAGSLVSCAFRPSIFWHFLQAFQYISMALKQLEVFICIMASDIDFQIDFKSSSQGYRRHGNRALPQFNHHIGIGGRSMFFVTISSRAALPDALPAEISSAIGNVSVNIQIIAYNYNIIILHLIYPYVRIYIYMYLQHTYIL